MKVKTTVEIEPEDIDLIVSAAYHSYNNKTIKNVVKNPTGVSIEHTDWGTIHLTYKELADQVGQFISDNFFFPRFYGTPGAIEYEDAARVIGRAIRTQRKEAQ